MPQNLWRCLVFLQIAPAISAMDYLGDDSRRARVLQSGIQFLTISVDVLVRVSCKKLCSNRARYLW
jgi:hypothetical protein